MARLNKQHDKLVELLSDVKLTNYKDKTAQVVAFLEKYIGLAHQKGKTHNVTACVTPSVVEGSTH